MILSVEWLAAGEGLEWGVAGEWATGRKFRWGRDGHLDQVANGDDKWTWNMGTIGQAKLLGPGQGVDWVWAGVREGSS